MSVFSVSHRAGRQPLGHRSEGDSFGKGASVKERAGTQSSYLDKLSRDEEAAEVRFRVAVAVQLVGVSQPDLGRRVDDLLAPTGVHRLGAKPLSPVHSGNG